MASGKPILYSYFRSSCSYRVRIALAWKNIDYEYKPVNLLKQEQKSDEVTKLNPLQEIPVFVDGNNTLTQSLPIIEYIEETRPQKSLFPKDPALRAKSRAMAELIGSGIQPLQNLNILNRVEDPDQWAKFFIERGFAGLEKILAPIHGKCCIQDEVTIADLCLVPQVYNATVRFGIDMKKFPIISKIYEHLNTYEAFKVSHPSVQPDTPKE